jgi:mono/diheme cytochrome c family protein
MSTGLARATGMLRILTVVAALLAVAAVRGAHGQRLDVTPSLVHPSMRGQDIFEFYCAPCHGLDGTGGGPVAVALKTRPPDLTKLAARTGGGFPRDRADALVAGGPDELPAHGSPDMPIWGPIFRALDPSDALADERIRNVVEYIESMQQNEAPAERPGRTGR